jgi:hypothetical protein
MPRVQSRARQLSVPVLTPTPPAVPLPLQRTNSQVVRNRHTGSGFNPFEEKTGVSCDIKLELLSGNEVNKLSTLLKKADITRLCRGSVGDGYVKDLLKKKKESAFAILAKNERGLIVGFTRNLVYSAYAGGDNSNKRIRDPNPIKERIVMLDLVCTDKDCSGLGKIMVRSLVDTARDVYGATLLMLEATSEAAGFYARFGFRRVPNACSWSEPAIKEAQAAFEARQWTEKEKQPYQVFDDKGKARTVPSYKSAAEVNKALGGVWWKYYNRPPNGTVIMSLCLGKPKTASGKMAFAAKWTSPAAMRAVTNNGTVTAKATPPRGPSPPPSMSTNRYLVPNWREKMAAALAARPVRVTRSSARK